MIKELKIENLHVSLGEKEIIKGLDLRIKQGEIHALMGPNGSGKSTLSFAIMGHPKYKVTRGNILLNGRDMTKLSTDERARAGLFLSFQYPSEIPGVSMANFLRTAYNQVNKISINDFMALLNGQMQLLKMDKDFAKRYVNVGFSGGEKKKAEILQMAILKPKYAILDETDSGLDVDALRIVANGIKRLSDSGILIITHYQRILHYIKPNRVHIMIDGRITNSGDYRLAEDIEKKGYQEAK